MGSVDTPKITLYTSYFCPWAHRAQVILKELDLPFETVKIDLTVPRTEEYLKINPRGLVPALKYNDDIITESGIVAKFLADAHPSHILPVSNAPGGALKRARIDFFVDAYFSKVQGQFYPLQLSDPGSPEAAAKVETLVAAIVKEVEPLLADAAPYFGGSDRFTLAEVQTASFLLRLLEFPGQGIIPADLPKKIEAQAPNFWKWANEVIKQDSVRYIWDLEAVAGATKTRVAKMKADAASK